MKNKINLPDVVQDLIDKFSTTEVLQAVLDIMNEDYDQDMIKHRHTLKSASAAQSAIRWLDKVIVKWDES